MGLPCYWCGHPIDYTLDSERHPLAFTCDELHPISRGGDPLDPTNLVASHRVCNGSRGTKPDTLEVRARCRAVYAKHAARQRHRTVSAAW